MPTTTANPATAHDLDPDADTAPAADERTDVHWEIATGLVLVCALAVGYLPHRVQVAGTVAYGVLAAAYFVWRLAGRRRRG